MRQYFAIALALGIGVGALANNATQAPKSQRESSDTAGTQREKPKKSAPRQKLKIQKPPKVESHPAGLDSLNPELYMPLLRQKDSTMNRSY